MTDAAKYDVLPFPLMRRAIIDVGRTSRWRHMIHGLVEIDVTDARQHIRDHRARTGESLSFTAFILSCLGCAIAENRSIQAYRSGGSKLIVFHDVDVTSLIEVEADGNKFPLAHIFRATNRRTVQELHQEIRDLQSDPDVVRKTDGYNFVRWFMLLPAFLRDVFYRYLYAHPHFLRRHLGTVALTAVGMFGQGGGWGIPIATHNVNVTLGGIAQKPGVVNGEIAVREMLDVTLSFNHDTVDGAPAARFAKRLKELIEGCYGLDEVVEVIEDEPVPIPF
jgi:pyruvate/2-oxoglutarate dehydrogenase complex dihydrolipoamide acyltransferase (E2) component